MSGVNTRGLTYIALSSALVCVSAYLAVPLPFTPVPITLQTAAVACVALVMPTGVAVASVVLYVLLGVVGLPVFAHGAGGLGVLMGPTGGFIAGFPLMAAVVSVVYRLISKTRFKKFFGALIAVFAGNAVLYVCGAGWFCFVTSRPPIDALLLCVVPYLATDAFKAVLAVFLAASLRRAGFVKL